MTSGNLLYTIIILPGAIVLWILSGFKKSFFKMLEPINWDNRLHLVSWIIWVLVGLFFFIKNN